MSNFTVTPAMSLNNPTPQVDPGPDYANNIQAALNVIDGHTHTGAPNDGYQVPTAGLNINADLTFNFHNAIAIRSLRGENNTNILNGVADIDCAYWHGGNFYINNNDGYAVQITSGTSVVGPTSSSTNAFVFQTVAGNWTIASTDTYSVLHIDTTAARTVTLPAANAVTAGRFYIIKDASGQSAVNNITINPAGADTIDGATSALVNFNYAAIIVISNGSNGWDIVALFKPTPIRAVTTYTVDSSGPDEVLLVDTTATRNITLPTPTIGRKVTIKDKSGQAETNNITVIRHSTEKIEGLAASYKVATNFASVKLISDGTDWYIL